MSKSKEVDEQYDLTTDKGGDVPLTSSLETPDSSQTGFEVTEEEKTLKRGEQTPIAQEEGIASVSGPPADSNMNIMDDEPLVLTSGTEENLTDDNLTDDTLTDKVLGEGILLNENYIQDQFGVFYRPVYVGEEYTPHPHDLIFENKYYTTEGLGNCVFCQGAGKVTVENLGLKDCPDCDGTGDMQSANPMDPNGMMQPPMDPNQEQPPNIGMVPDISDPMDPQQMQQPTDNAPDQFGNDPSQPTAQAQIPAQPSQNPNEKQLPPQEKPEEKKPSFGETFIPKIDERIDVLITERLNKKLGTEDNPNHADDGKFTGGSGSSDNNSKAKDILMKIRNREYQLEDGDTDWDMVEKKRKEATDLMKSEESCKCKKKSHEASVKNYKDFINREIIVLKSRARKGESVSVMYGLPTVSKEGRKIKGKLAYAGVSLNDRIYLPEELKKGDEKTLPLLLNHSSIAGAENELDRLSPEMLNHLENEKDFQVGEVTLRWEPEELTLYYEGIVTNEFFQKEIDDMDMAVSLGIYYDSDSPKICDENCYTVIKGAEFREVSLVYHAGFPIATIEAVEAQLKADSMKSIEAEGDGYFKTDVGYVCKTCNTEIGTLDNIKNHIKTAHPKATEDHFELLDDMKDKAKDTGDDKHVEDVQTIIDDVKEETTPKEGAEEELDPLAQGGSVDVEEEPTGEPLTIDINEDVPIGESLSTMHNFSIRGVTGMTISNSNGVERYKLDPNMSYETNMIHFDVAPTGAKIFGEEIQMQPKMTTPPDITKILEDKPDIKFTDADEDVL